MGGNGKQTKMTLWIQSRSWCIRQVKWGWRDLGVRGGFPRKGSLEKLAWSNLISPHIPWTFSLGLVLSLEILTRDAFWLGALSEIPKLPILIWGNSHHVRQLRRASARKFKDGPMFHWRLPHVCYSQSSEREEEECKRPSNLHLSVWSLEVRKRFFPST